MNGAGSGVPGVLVGGKIEHPGVGVEDFLCPVAVMDIEIHNEYPFQFVVILSIFGCYGDIVEQTKAHRLTDSGVMPRRSHYCEGVVNLTCHHRIESSQCASYSVEGNLVRGGRGIGVAVQPAAAACSGTLDTGEGVAAMCRSQLFCSSSLYGEGNEFLH